MLHKETVDRKTLDLILKLQSDQALRSFVLVGGTGLSLQLGHRISVDLDFFTRSTIDNHMLLEHLEENYGFQEQYRHHNTLKGIIDGGFVDLIRHDYPWVRDPLETDGIRIASTQDIAAMKINAISGNGTRVKDFIDIYFLLKEFSFKELIDFYKTKYITRNDFHAIKSLTYFDDIIVEEWPVMILDKDLKFEGLKKEIMSKRDRFLGGKLYKTQE